MKFPEKILKFVAFLCLILFFTGSADAQTVIGSEQFKIIFDNNSSGAEILAIQKDGTDLLKDKSDLFSLNITKISTDQNTTISSAAGWSNVQVNNTGGHCEIIFSNPDTAALPDSLTVAMTTDISFDKSQWDLSVSGLGADHSLLTVTFPELKIKADGNDHFLAPKFSGRAVPDPVAGNIDLVLPYPRGWRGTLPFLSYYNNQYGIYLGYHDPDASLKSFIIKAENDYVKFSTEIQAANKTLPANNWDLPGVFELDLYNGDWYEAAMIYKKWASASADYWPQLTPARIERQNNIGKIGVWGYFSSDPGYPMASIENEMNDFVDFFPDVPTGIHWYRWNGLADDDNYPDYFPERTGMTDLVTTMQASGDTVIMPYINGRLYDTDLPNYNTAGFPYATKNSANLIYSQDFAGNHFAVMCPTQTVWQDILVDASSQLTNRIGSNGIYIDQVCAAGPTECMDPDHNHALGGGHLWRDGYNEMFEKIHATIPAGKFVAVEGGTDYLADEVDGFLTDGWIDQDLVPAFQAVYGDRVQFFGTRTGTSTYNDQSFYCKLAQSFVNGIQPGRFSLWMVHDPNAAATARDFVKDIATLRYKLRDFLSFGRLLRPIEITGNIPGITSAWRAATQWEPAFNVTISAIQSGVYKNKNNRSVAIVFANASMTDTLNFSFDFNAGDYGLAWGLKLQKITAAADGVIEPVTNHFSKEVQLAPMETFSYIVAGHPVNPWLLFMPAILGTDE